MVRQWLPHQPGQTNHVWQTSHQDRALLTLPLQQTACLVTSTGTSLGAQSDGRAGPNVTEQGEHPRPHLSSRR